MKKEEKEKLESERAEINKRAASLIRAKEKAEAELDFEQVEKLEKELTALSRRQKRILWKFGLYKPKEGEEVEYQPGKFMPAEHFYWLME